jgi:hypothetical protein
MNRKKNSLPQEFIFNCLFKIFDSNYQLILSSLVFNCVFDILNEQELVIYSWEIAFTHSRPATKPLL